jgi:uncharacterized Tic20 family protein
MNLVDELAKLDSLHQSGALTDAEYQDAKAALLAKHQPASKKFKDASDVIVGNADNWGMFIHLSQYLGYLIPVLGLAVPIVLWQMKREDPVVDRHGRIVVNWIITELILLLIGFLLSFIIIGIPLLWLLGICMAVFPAIGAVQAYRGEAWDYPATIHFL